MYSGLYRVLRGIIHLILSTNGLSGDEVLESLLGSSLAQVGREVEILEESPIPQVKRLFRDKQNSEYSKDVLQTHDIHPSNSKYSLAQELERRKL